VRVRMGVHTGEAEIRQGDYVGLDMHRAARMCGAGHGGQVLISSSTRELVADELPADAALRDLGEHRLKDLDSPEHLFQLVVGDLPADCPAIIERNVRMRIGGTVPTRRGSTGLCRPARRSAQPAVSGYAGTSASCEDSPGVSSWKRPEAGSAKRPPSLLSRLRI
jgi:hypothetical protein